MTSARRTHTPTKADWDAAIVRFQAFRRMEKPDDLRRAQRLPRLLAAIAQEAYDGANELERTGALVVDLADFGASMIAERLAFGGYAREVQQRCFPLEFLTGLPVRLAPSPAAIRGWAHGLRDNADRGHRLVVLYGECVEMLRGSTSSGPAPSVSMYWLIRRTDEWGETVPEIARQLLRRGVIPESRSDEPHPQHQWEMLLKKGRERARRRVVDRGDLGTDR